MEMFLLLLSGIMHIYTPCVSDPFLIRRRSPGLWKGLFKVQGFFAIEGSKISPSGVVNFPTPATVLLETQSNLKLDMLLTISPLLAMAPDDTLVSD